MEEDESYSVKADLSPRTLHACEACRKKRVRCSGDRPVCIQCREQRLACEYGYPRGGRRRSILAALDDRAALRGLQSSLRISPPGHLDNAVDSQHMDGFRHMDGVQLTDGAQHTDGVDHKLHSAGISPDDDYDSDSGSDAPGEADVDGASVDGTTETSSSHITSPLGASTQPTSVSSRSHKGKGKGKSRDGRRQRISNACQECKKRKRKCTGDQPCQTCTTFNTECVYDRSQDRRSKAYFQRKLAQGVQEALESDDRANLLDILKSSGNVDDDVALGFREAMQLAEQDRQAVRTHSAKVPLTLSNPGTVASFEESDRPMVPIAGTDGLVCDTLCAVGIPGVVCPEWVSKEQWIQQQVALSGPPHLMQPFIIEDHSPLSRLYKSFMNGARQMIAEGAATLEGILGPLDAEVDLLYRDRIPSDAFCASTFACEVVKYYSNVDMDTQMAHAFLLARWMRWILAPNRENYVLLPELVKPTRLQQRVPHFASAGVQVLPEIRDHLVRGELQMTRDIGPQVSAFGIKFNWRFDKWQAVERNPVTGVTTVSRLFAESVVDVENWSCPKNFTEHSPGPDAIIQVVNHHHSWNRLEAFLAAS